SLTNAAARSLFGDSVRGRLISDMLRHPDFHTALDRVLTSGGKTVVRLPLNTAAGHALFSIQITPLAGRSAAGSALIAFEDQTALEQATAIRRDFVANVSHELRTPLTALVGFIETLRGAARDDATARDRFLAIMEREAGRMIRLVNDLLSLSRVEAEEHRRPAETVEITGVLRSVLTTQRDQAAQAGVEMALAAERPELFVRGDPDQLLQVFLNLAENGIKYGGAGGRLDFSVTRIPREPKLRGPAISVEVADQGEGIDPIHLPRLTERFYRVDSHRSREKGGTGLGLAIVKHIVNRHRGRLKVESAPGKGSKFIVILPEA
ncbi:MAG: ATP-binding protein, partial [Pseudomonadota bacterium]